MSSSLVTLLSPLFSGFDTIHSAWLGVTTTAAPPVDTATAAAADAATMMDWRTRLFWSGVQAFCAIIYGRWFVRALRNRGRVRAERFGPPEAGIALVLSGLILTMTIAGFLLNTRVRGGAAATPSAGEIINTVVSTTALQLLLVVGLLAGWAARHIPIAETLGFAPPAIIHWSAERPPPTLGQAIRSGVGFVLAAYPLLLGAAELVGKLTGISHLNSGQEEEAIRLFKASAGLGPKAAMIVAAVVVAPLLEEFLFRGYLYPVFRRYLGAGPGILLNSALFAGVHAHLPSLAPLFVLAVCLTLAYEATGSLLVPILMHALFNSFNVALLILGLTGGGGGT